VTSPRMKQLGVGGDRAPHALVDLEVVVGGEERDGGVEGWVVEDGIRDLALHEALWRRSYPSQHRFLTER